MTPAASAQWERLGRPDLARLWIRARRQIEQIGAIEGTISLSDATEAELGALGGLLGRARTGKAPRVSLGELDAALRRGPGGFGLIDVLVQLGGPLRDVAGEQRAELAAVEGLCREAGALLGDEPWVASWLHDLRADGSLTRLCRGAERSSLLLAARCLARLPVAELPIAQLAGELTGDTKALSAGTLPTLVLRGLASRSGEARPERAGERRVLWERWGVIVDDLASQVLVLNLRSVEGGPLGRWLCAAAHDGTPVRVTLHQLARYPLSCAIQPVYICENPAILRAAAARLGGRAAALVCTEGQPSAAFDRLIRAIVASGCELSARADFDRAGLRIAGQLYARYGATPWRFSAVDYQAALACAPDAPALTGPRASSPWDPSLAEMLESCGRAVYEEVLVDRLIEDLRIGGSSV